MKRYNPNYRIVSCRGSVTATTFTVLNPWVNALEYPATVGATHIVSSSANDAEAGTGARTVYIEYLDGDFKTQFQTATLNGTGNVSIAAPLRIQEAYIQTAGSGGVAAGNIDILVTSGSGELARIPAGRHSSYQGSICVPAGHVGLVHDYTPMPNPGAAYHAEYYLEHRGITTDEAWKNRPMAQGYGASGSGAQIVFKHPLVFPEKTDIRMGVYVSNGGVYTGSFGIEFHRI